MNKRWFLSRLLSAAGMLLLFGWGDPAAAQEWTRFRGPNGSGASESAKIPAEIDQSDYRWKIKLPGQGHSSPVLWGERLFLMSSDAETATRYLLCINANDGEIIWQEQFASRPHHLHSRSSYSSGSPAVDEERVYFVWAEPSTTTLCALTHEGKKVWQRDLGPFLSQHGFGGSPIVHDDQLVFFHSQQADSLDPGQTPGVSRMMAFDCATGETLWETPLKTTRVCYSVPAIYEDETTGREWLIGCNTGNGMFALDASDGSLAWDMPVFRMRTVASAVVANGIALGSNGSGGGGNYLVGVQIGEEPQELFRVKTSANYVPTPIVHNNLAFLFNDKGIVSCVDLETGKQHWRQRLADGFSGSPVRVQDRLYAIAEDGTLFVVSANDEYRLLSEHNLGEPSRSTPAVANDRMFLRTVSHLIAIGAK